MVSSHTQNVARLGGNSSNSSHVPNIRHFLFDGGRSSVVRASEFDSEDPGFDPDPLAGQGVRQLVIFT